MSDQQGPVEYEPRHEKVNICNGCTYLHKTAGLRSRTEHRDDYDCQHPDFNNEQMIMTGKRGRTIHFNIPYPCETPSWCPFLKKPNQ